ncbi:MAG: hypothetical protein DI586_08610 [Micavibrio aeruginosavorus]|uniref:Uncharacterized protein n=1 Tax=Micavibrio aeruginosavorus TaxID=349221 RepID=A0A2W5FM14_9BACT|nr:MAG: hypothetical protein DI586_08610 [Micavibrio aeruginosavorus]
MSEKNKREIQNAITETMEKAVEYTAEVSDIVLDIATDNDFLDKIPVVSWAIKGLKIKDIYQKRKLERNAFAFLMALGACNSNKLDEFKDFLNAQLEQRDEFIDTTMSILLEGEKPIKASLYGKLLAARIRNLLSHEEFEIIAMIIYAASVPALNAIKSYFRRTNGKPYITHAGAVEEEPLLMSLGVASRFGNGFRVDERGQNFYRYCFDGTVVE